MGWGVDHERLGHYENPHLKSEITGTRPVDDPANWCSPKTAPARSSDLVLPIDGAPGSRVAAFAYLLI